MHAFASAIVAAAEGEQQPILLPAVYDLIWGGVSFVIVLLLFWKFVLPTMQKVLAERTDKIEGGIARAEAMQVEAAAALESYKAQLAEAREEAAQIRTEAQSERRAIVEQAKTEAAAAARQVTEAAEANLARERAEIVASLTTQVGQVAVQLASKVVGQSLADDARVRTTVEQFIADLERQASAGTAADPHGPRAGR